MINIAYFDLAAEKHIFKTYKELLKLSKSGPKHCNPGKNEALVKPIAAKGRTNPNPRGPFCPGIKQLKRKSLKIFYFVLIILSVF